MARSKLKRGGRAQPHDPMQIYISGPTMLIDDQTRIRVGQEYFVPAEISELEAGWWTATRVLANRVEFQQHRTGRFEKFKKADLRILGETHATHLA